jgi:hypothetical protein
VQRRASTSTPRANQAITAMRGLRAAVLLSLIALSISLVMTTVAAGSPARPIEVKVDLSHHRVVAGHSIKGTVVLTNTTKKPITVNTCAANGWLNVGLKGPAYTDLPINALIACAPTVRLAPGINRFPVSVITTYSGCVEPQPSGPSTATKSTPICTVDGPPPLPAGSYSTEVAIVGLTGLTRRPNRLAVRLTKPKNEPMLANCANEPGESPPQVTVPNVVGESSSFAALAMAHACLNASYASPVGHLVASESPAAGSKVPEYSTVTLSTR